MGYFNTHIFDLLKKFGCKMQTCRRRCGGAFVNGIYCLIPVFVLKLMRYIRRKGHFAKLVKNSFKYSVIVEFNNSVSAFNDIKYLRFQSTVAECYYIAGFSLFAWICKYFPCIKIFTNQKKNFNSGSCVFSCSD